MFAHLKARDVLVERVVTCFRAMGASEDQLQQERRRLREEPRYLEDWADTCHVRPKARWWTLSFFSSAANARKDGAVRKVVHKPKIIWDRVKKNLAAR